MRCPVENQYEDVPRDPRPAPLIIKARHRRAWVILDEIHKIFGCSDFDCRLHVKMRYCWNSTIRYSAVLTEHSRRNWLDKVPSWALCMADHMLINKKHSSRTNWRFKAYYSASCDLGCHHSSLFFVRILIKTSWFIIFRCSVEFCTIKSGSDHVTLCSSLQWNRSWLRYVDLLGTLPVPANFAARWIGVSSEGERKKFTPMNDGWVVVENRRLLTAI